MSFSGQVKEELSHRCATPRHCQIAELAAIVSMCGHISINSRNQHTLRLHTENIAVARKCFTLIQKTFKIEPEISVRRNLIKGSSIYIVAVPDHEVTLRILQATKLLDSTGEVEEELSIVKNVVVQETCCKRAFIRGAFLTAGSMSDPQKSYHFEIVCATMEKAFQMETLINSFGMDAKIVRRKKSYVVYLKEGEQIVDMLNVMEAHVSLMELENIRIMKETRNSVNRKVNCEMANLNKTVSASVKQVQDIEFLERVIGLDKLSEELQQAAYARLAHPSATLKELGGFMEPPVGKSGVNHRLRKISLMAEDYRR